MTKQKIKIAHSPDSDDAFMFYALKNGKVTSDKYDFDIQRKDIEELNQLATEEVYDITAISFHAYAYLSDKYYLTRSGSSMAEKNYGPMVISKSPKGIEDLKNLHVAIPGQWTTAHLVLKLIEPNIKVTAVPFEDIMPRVLNDEFDAGLIIHEGQLQYQEQGLHKIVGLNEYWKSIAGDLPLPLGSNAVKKSLGKDVATELSNLQLQSIQYAMDNLEEARNYALQFKRDLSPQDADQYLSWYANDRTLDMGIEGEKAAQLLFNTAFDRGLLKSPVQLEIV